jgi:beta-glucosidase
MNRKCLRGKLTAGVATCLMVTTAYVPVYAASTSNAVSERETTNAQISMQAATQGMVLLQNKNNTLPIAQKGKIALFGGGAYVTVKGGTGSGDVNQRYTVPVWDAIKKAGYSITSSNWLESYKKSFDKQKVAYDKKNAGNWWAAPFNLPDYALTDADIKTASQTDTAIYVVSRNSGEGSDRTAKKGDYYLTDAEYANIKKMALSFKNSIVVLNVGGIIDTKFAKDIPQLDSVVLMSQAGMEGGTAALKVLDGEVTPSGKLTDTWAVNYSDYPSSTTFSSNDGNSLKEDYTDDIYVGYRYFDTFNVTPAYSFGYGLSYTSFDMKTVSVTADEKKVTVKVKVTNTGKKYSGKEVAQVYFSAPNGDLEKPYQELAAYGKTDLLAPGQSQTLTISYNTSEMSSYSEKDAAYEMEKGNYVIRVGNSSRNTHVAAALNLGSTVKTEQLSNQMKIDKKITTLSNKEVPTYSYEGEQNEIAKAQKISLSSKELELIDGNNASKYDKEDVTTYVTEATKNDQTKSTSPYKETKVTVDGVKDAKLYDVYSSKITMQQFVASLSVQKMADIVEGIGMSGNSSGIIGAQANSVPGAAGETTSNYFDTDGIPNIVLSDGPAGIRITQSYKNNNQTYYQYCTAFPIGTLLAQTWDPEVVKSTDNALGKEMLEYGATLWLAPGMNIHRNPLCGRNFEYYSEDPFIAGTMAVAATTGVQSNPGIGVTIKHYATNNQENDRTTEYNTVSERALREIYLKGFEMAIKGAQPMAIMTSYNGLNGVPAADSYDLCTDFPRGEWGFKGLIMTDWGGGMSTPSKSMHAGNDLIMPGGSQDNIVEAVIDEAPTFGKDGYVANKTVMVGWSSKAVEAWNDFVLSESGTKTVSAKVAAGTALNKKVSEMVSAGKASVAFDTTSSTTGLNVMTDTTCDRIVTYKGDYADNNTLALGDLQRSTMNVLNIIMQSTQFAKMNADKGVTATSYMEKNNNLKSYVTLSK